MRKEAAVTPLARDIVALRIVQARASMGIHAATVHMGSRQFTSTRILGRRTAPFCTFSLFPTASRVILPKILVLLATAQASIARGLPFASAGAARHEQRMQDGQPHATVCMFFCGWRGEGGTWGSRGTEGSLHKR